jgi:hypothetical protein
VYWYIVFSLLLEGVRPRPRQREPRTLKVALMETNYFLVRALCG